MVSLNWLNGDAAQLFGQHVMWSDALGNMMGLVGLVLGQRRSVWTWPAQLAAGIVLLAAYTSAHLISGVIKQLLALGVAAWGWRQWHRGPRDDAGRITVRLGTRRERLLLTAGAAAGILAAGVLFRLCPGLSWRPWLDAFFLIGTLIAMVAQSRGLVECWLAWLLVDLVGVPLAFSNGLAFSGLVFALYFVLNLHGGHDWWLRAHPRGHLRSPPGGPPALTPAPEIALPPADATAEETDHGHTRRS